MTLGLYLTKQTTKVNKKNQEISPLVSPVTAICLIQVQNLSCIIHTTGTFFLFRVMSQPQDQDER